jgi:filamentous hemagglutinin
MERIPALRKLLVAAGRIRKGAEAVTPEAKLLAHLEQAIINKVLQQGLKLEEIAQLAKLDKAAAEKLLRELPAKDVLELETQLGKTKLEELAKTQSAKEIQAAAKKTAAEIAAAEKAAAAKKVAAEILGRLREEAAEVRKSLLPGKEVGRKNVAVAEVHLDNGTRMSASSTSGPKGNAPKPKPASEGGQFEPRYDPDGGRVMDTDPEYKILSQLAERIEQQYPKGSHPQGTVYLYSEIKLCASPEISVCR